MDVNMITEKIIGCVYKVSNTLGAGFLEKVYENALVVEIGWTGLAVAQQVPFKVLYNGAVVGSYLPDLLVEQIVLLEVKAVRLLEDVHVAQCMNYLRATGLPVCLLVNFYRPKVEIRRIIPYDAWKSRKP